MKIVEVSAAIIIKDNKIFITQRGYGDQKDKWEFPGGKIEKGETPEDCIIREIKEELDADIRIIKKLNVIEYNYPSFHLVMHNFIVQMKNPHILLREHEASRYVDLNEVDTIDFLEADKLVLKDLKDYLFSLFLHH